MASINVGGGASGKKAVDHDVPLIPFIDLLLCCVMFLLVSAVWTQLGRLETNQQASGPVQSADPVAPSVKLMLQIQSTGYMLATTAGDNTPVPKVGEAFDLAGLTRALHARRAIDGERRDITVVPEDGIAYSEVVHAMDAALGEGYSAIDLSDAANL